MYFSPFLIFIFFYFLQIQMILAKMQKDNFGKTEKNTYKKNFFVLSCNSTIHHKVADMT